MLKRHALIVSPNIYEGLLIRNTKLKREKVGDDKTASLVSDLTVSAETVISFNYGF